MLFVVENGLVKMGYAPSLRDWVVEQLSQLLGCLACYVIAPCSEWRQEIAILVKNHVSVHHGAEPDGLGGAKNRSVLFLNIVGQFFVTVLYALPDVIQAVSPDAVY